MRKRLAAVVAAVALCLGLVGVAPAVAADPEPIPCAPGECGPVPECDAQHAVNLGLHLARVEARADRLAEKVQRRGEVIERLRRKLDRARGVSWQ